MSGALWRFAGVLAEATPSPSPTPGLRDGLEESMISPGLAGFLAVFAIALASLALFYSLTRKLRRVKYRGELAEAAAADDGEVPDAGAPGTLAAGSTKAPDGGAPGTLAAGSTEAPERPESVGDERAAGEPEVGPHADDPVAEPPADEPG